MEKGVRGLVWESRANQTGRWQAFREVSVLISMVPMREDFCSGETSLMLGNQCCSKGYLWTS